MKKRILHIDDSIETQVLVAEVLVEAGYEVVSEPDVPGGYLAARTSRFDLVLLDLELGSDTSGRSVLDLLFSRGEWIPPICLVTAHTEAALRDMFPRALPNRIHKPMDPDELVATVARMTGTRTP